MLEADSMKMLAAISTPRNYARGQYICYEGEPGTEMFIIVKGNVGVYVSDASEQLREITRFRHPPRPPMGLHLHWAGGHVSWGVASQVGLIGGIAGGFLPSCL